MICFHSYNYFTINYTYAHQCNANKLSAGRKPVFSLLLVHQQQLFYCCHHLVRTAEGNTDVTIQTWCVHMHALWVFTFSLPYQHNHTPVEDSSVVIVTTGWTQQGLLCPMTTTKMNKKGCDLQIDFSGLQHHTDYTSNDEYWERHFNLIKWSLSSNLLETKGQRKIIITTNLKK